MKEESKYPFSLVDEANEKIKKYGKEIQIVQHTNEPQYFTVDILTIDDKGEIVGDYEFADNYFENELEEVVKDALNYVLETEKFDEEHKDYICYRKVSGWTHDMPALIWSLTEFPLYFFDNQKLTVELVDDNETGIDAYENRDGYFCVLPEDYEAAIRQVNDHDERGVEH